MMTSTVSATGTNGIIKVEGAFVRIEKTKNLGSFFNQGVQGDRAILIRFITAIEFRDTNSGTNGFISFDFPGKNPPKAGVFDALADENAVVFSKKDAPAFRSVWQAIVTEMAKYASASV